MKVGGASGPLYGTLFMSLGKTLNDEVNCAQIGRRLSLAAIEAVKAARQVRWSDKRTMLDVLVFPVLDVLREGGAGLPLRLKATAKGSSGKKTIPMRGDPRAGRHFWANAVSATMGPRCTILRVDRRRGRRWSWEGFA